jgi:hypothetical protein
VPQSGLREPATPPGRHRTTITYINSQKTHCPSGHPYDRVYSGARYCSICEAAKKKRLRAKWRLEDTLNI